MFDVQSVLLSALAATDDEAVRRAGNILGRGWAGRTHPFYDPQTDDVRLIPPQQPTPQPFRPRLTVAGTTDLDRRIPQVR